MTSEPPPASLKAPVAAGARRVLIVDDNVDAAQSMALLAETWGHEVATAQDGDEALVLAERFLPDTALVDIGLPGIDGYELGRRLRREPRHREMHLVAMTGYGRPEDREAARAAGFDVHMVKPVDIDALQHLLANGRPRSDAPV